MAYRQPEIKFSHAPGTVVTSTYQTNNLAPETTIRREETRYITTSQAGGRHSNVLVSQHTHHQNTDNLYRPLKETLAHPEIVRQHADYTPEAAKSSMVSQRYRRLNTKELHNLVNLALFRKKTPTFPMPNSSPPITSKEFVTKSSWQLMPPKG